MAGQAWLAGKLGTVAFGQGEAMILGATLLWSVEVVFVKHLLGSVPPRVAGGGAHGPRDGPAPVLARR